jgi:two-component system NtrC family sensor kinase
MGVIDTHGRHLAYVGPYDLLERNYREADWFDEVMTRKVYISDVFLGFRQVPHCIIAVKTAAGSERWILRATINSDQFDAIVGTAVLGENSDAYIVNREGLYQTTPKVGAVLDRAPVPVVGFHRGVQDRRLSANDTVKIEVTAWINDNRWMLAVHQDLAAVQAPVDQAIAQGAYVVLIAVALLVATTFIATWYLTSRIDKANIEREEMSRAFMRSAKLASVGELATGLAHEINNPLAILSAEQTNISDVLLEAGSGSQWREEALDSVERCQTQVRRCASITQKMLQFGRKRETTLELTNIAPRLKEISNLLQRRASVRNIEIALTAEENLPQVLIDPVELEQVLVNLINNSIDALPKGGYIRVKARREGDQVHLEVQDNGVGIAREELERIFEPFYTTKPTGEGTGLGLSVCYGIVHSWGGRIKADSEPGKGTTMRILLPLKRQNGATG